MNPNSPVKGHSLEGEAMVDADHSQGDRARSLLVTIATVAGDDADALAKPAGGPDNPVSVQIVDGQSTNIACDVLELQGLSIIGERTVLNADPTRRALTVRNASDTKMTVRVDGQDATSTSYPLDSGRGYEFPVNMIPAGRISVYCAVADKQWNAFFVGDPDSVPE